MNQPTSTQTKLASSRGDDGDSSGKPRILCLHGAFQSGSIFANKIGGARRKLKREYELDFIDGPVILPQNEGGGESNAQDATEDSSLAPRSWWLRSEDGKHSLVREAFDHVIEQTASENYDAIIGFSQGGTLATALALSGAMPNVRAVVTAGAPYIDAAFEVASEMNSSSSDGFEWPKLHLAGENDAMVPVESTQKLCDIGGKGKLIIHDQGHLFPTRSARVKEVMDFLGKALSSNEG
ncbi:hypothetical protein ACHAWF_009182 [Thalassiosira exigua]